MENTIIPTESSYVEREGIKFRDYVNSEEFKNKLQQRLFITASTQQDQIKKAYALNLCREDPLFFINNFGWTYDPRPEHRLTGDADGNLPFVLFEYQENFIKEMVAAIQGGQDLYIDKSRDMGATQCAMWIYVWFWLFGNGFSGHIGSRKEELVDNRTRDSLMGILDFALRSLPSWLLPDKFNFKKHRMHLKLINPMNGNLITGESMNPDFSRQSRKTCVIFDELAFWDFGREAWDSAGDTTPCRIGITTPCGRNHAALIKESGIKNISLHWKLHPLKDQGWYNYQKSRRTEEEIAQELDISYQKSQEGRVYPEWDDVEYGLYSYDSEFPLFVAWDFGQTDDTAIIWGQKGDNGKWKIVDCYSNRGKTIDFYVPFVTGMLPSGVHNYSKKDIQLIKEHNTWPIGTHFGDPAGRFTNQVTNRSVIDVLGEFGIHVNFKEESKDFQSRKTAAKLLMRNLVVNKNERTEYLGICMSNSAYPKVRDKGSEIVKSIKPRHDSFSHYRSAFEYFAIGLEQTYKVRRVVDKFGNDKNKEVMGRRGKGHMRLIGY